MGQSLILLINELAPNQTNAFQTVNDAVAALENASNAVLDFDLVSFNSIDNNPTLPVTDMVSYGAIRLFGQTEALQLGLPPEIEPTTPVPTQRILGIINDGEFTITCAVHIDEPMISVPPFSSKVINIDGLVLRTIAAVTPHTVGAYAFGTPGPEDIILRYNFVESVEYQSDFAASFGSIGVLPTVDFEMTVNKNGVEVGTVTISDAGVYTFETDAGDPVQFDYGDELQIVAPLTPDITVAGIAFTLLGKRV